MMMEIQISKRDIPPRGLMEHPKLLSLESYYKKSNDHGRTNLSSDYLGRVYDIDYCVLELRHYGGFKMISPQLI